jgi:hypothetical protein
LCRLPWVWLLVFAVSLHAGLAAASPRALGSSRPSEEESDSRQLPAEEEVAGVHGTAPPRAFRFSAAASIALLFNGQCPANLLFQRAVSMHLRAEHSARNGTGGPLRC